MGFAKTSNSPHADIHYYERVFERSLKLYRDCYTVYRDCYTDPNAVGKSNAPFLRLGALDPLSLEEEKCAQDTLSQGKKKCALAKFLGLAFHEEFALYLEYVHRWLKSLYGHSPARAMLPVRPSTHHMEYALGYGHLLWLQPLLAAAPGGKAAAEVHIVPSFPSLDGAGEGKTIIRDQKTRFLLWPVQPGIRLLIPWLHMVREVFKKLEANSYLCGQNKSRVAILVPGGDVKQETIGHPFRACLRNIPKEEIDKRSGFFVGFQLCNEKAADAEQMVTGWRSTLMDPLRRRGLDTLPFAWLLSGDLGAVLVEKGLLNPTAEPLFQPLTGSMDVSLDMRVIEGPEEKQRSKSGRDSIPYLVIETTWSHEQPSGGQT